jgi:hypothetical protein
LSSLDDYSWSAGDKMDCCFKFDKRHGACTYTFFNGETFSCTWVDGRCPEFSARQKKHATNFFRQRLTLASVDSKRSAITKALRKMHFEVQ